MVRSRSYSLAGILSVKHPIINLVSRLSLKEMYYSLLSDYLLVL